MFRERQFLPFILGICLELEVLRLLLLGSFAWLSFLISTFMVLLSLFSDCPDLLFQTSLFTSSFFSTVPLSFLQGTFFPYFLLVPELDYTKITYFLSLKKIKIEMKFIEHRINHVEEHSQWHLVHLQCCRTTPLCSSKHFHYPDGNAVAISSHSPFSLP